MNIQLNELQSLMRMVFDDDELEISADTKREDVADWDSFSHIHLCAAFEKSFHVKLTTKQAMEISCVSDFLALLP